MYQPNDGITPEECFQRSTRAEDAIRDILYLYVTCLEYRRLFDDIGTEDGRFDPTFYVNYSEEDICFAVDLKLLHEGSAVKLACEALQSIGQGGYPESSYPKLNNHIKRTQTLIDSGHLTHLPRFEYFFKVFLNPARDKWFDELYRVAEDWYEVYVRGYFQALLDPPVNNP